MGKYFPQNLKREFYKHKTCDRIVPYLQQNYQEKRNSEVANPIMTNFFRFIKHIQVGKTGFTLMNLLFSVK